MKTLADTPTRLVLLRGLGREADHWPAGLENLLEDHEGLDARVVFIDLPGAGTAREEKAPRTIPGYTESIVRRLALDERRPGESTVLIALSLGGMIAIDWASRDPDLLPEGTQPSAAVLINTSNASVSPPWERFQPKAYPLVFSNLAKSAFSFGRKASRRDMEARESGIWKLTSSLPVDPEVIARWVDIQEERPLRTSDFLRQLFAAARYRLPKEKPQIPLMVANGRGDRLVSPTCSDKLASKWDLPLRCHPTAGHDLPMDDGPWLVETIAEWLATLPKVS